MIIYGLYLLIFHSFYLITVGKLMYFLFKNNIKYKLKNNFRLLCKLQFSNIKFRSPLTLNIN